MYLVLSKKGYYLSLSKEAAERKCRYLNIQNENILTCASFGDAKRYIQMFGKDCEIGDIKIGELVYWKPIQTVALVDIRAEESWRCRSDGTITWWRKGQKATSYHIGRDYLPNKKTETLLKKTGHLVFFDFGLQRVMRILVDGTVEAIDDKK